MACGPSPKQPGEYDPGEAFTVDVPSGAAGFTVVIRGPAGPADFLGLEAVTDPSGTAVVTDFHGVAQAGRSLSGQSGSATVAVRVPLADDFATQALAPGKWTLTVGGLSTVGGAPKGTTQRFQQRLRAAVFVQAAAGPGTLDLDVYVPDGLVVGGAAVDASSAGAALEERLTLAFGLFDRLFGLKRGDVRFHAVAAGFKAISGATAVDDANRLATVTAGAQVVLTNALQPEGGAEISGLSCVPGAVATGGTPCSAVLVSLRSTSAPWHDAATLVHELGHFAGLSHSTEFTGQTDGLADTPACTNLEKAALASCPDHDNLMFPSVNSATDLASISVSPTQRAVLRGSSLYR